MEEFVRMIGVAFAYYTNTGITSMTYQQRRDKTYVIIHYGDNKKEVCVSGQDEISILNTICKTVG